MKKLSKRIISFALAVMIIFSLCTEAFAAGEKYVKEVKIATGSTVDEAAEKLVEAGYTPIRSDLNSGNGTAVVLGYIATGNANEAITDLAVMKEKGGYSFTEYEAVLEKEKTAVAELIENITAAINEYRDNYDAETGAAVFAKDVMNYITNDDLDNRGMGDILYDESTTTEQLQTAFLQGNVQVCAALCADLGIACYGSESFLNNIEENPNKTYDVSIDSDAKLLLDKLSDFQKDMNTLADLGISDETDDDTFEEIFSEATTSDKDLITNAFPVYLALKDVEYKGTTLYDFLMGDLDEMETVDLYPVIDSMTSGQIAVLEYVTFSQVVQFTVTEDDAWAEQMETLKEDCGLDSSDTVSLFENVDRSIYDASGIALTNDALIKQNSDNDMSWTNGGASEKLKNASYVALFIGVGAGITGAIFLFMGYSQYAFNLAYQFSMDNLVRALTSDFVIDNLNLCSSMARGFAKSFTKLFAGVGIAVTLISLAAILFFVAVKIYDIIKKSKAHPVYSEMPRMLVDEAIDANENSVYTYYYCVTDTDGKNADLNAWNGSKWNGLYYTKDKNAGKPITVTNVVQMGEGKNVAPSAEYEGVHFFGESTAYNLNADSNYKKTVSVSNYTYLFFVHAKSSNTASVFSTYGYYALVALAGILVGSGLTMIVSKQKKKKEATA